MYYFWYNFNTTIILCYTFSTFYKIIGRLRSNFITSMKARSA
nr:MAG TPA: hypothetical protein [Caudoviricetes sp.]